MKCSEFWKRYESSGLTPELGEHLNECKSCYREYVIECEIDKTVRSLELFNAPESAWAHISSALDANPVKEGANRSLLQRIMNYLSEQSWFNGKIGLKPVFACLALVVLTTIVATHYITKMEYMNDKTELQEEAIREIEETEQKYLAAIEKFSRHIDDNKKSIDPELYDLYHEKLAILDECIVQCKEAIEENAYNINARQYLTLAYKEKAETLKEMAQKL